MIIIIDAYNVLKQVIAPQVSERDRAHFIALLSSYRSQKKHDVLLVFDGGITDRPSSERISGIRVVYSGRETADQYIIEYLEQHKNKDLLLVSSDRALIDQASQLQVPSLDATIFYGILKERRSVDGAPGVQSIVKTSLSASQELDRLMMEESEAEYAKQDEAAQPRRSPHNKVSKTERLLLKKIKKL